FEHPCLAVRSADGSIYLAVRDLCDAIGLHLAAQLRRLNRDSELRDGLERFRVLTVCGMQEQDFLMLEYVPMWLGTVSRARATPVVQERLRYLRIFTIRTVYDA